MAQPITELHIQVNKEEEEQLMKRGFIKVPINFNSAELPPLFLWYKRGSSKPVTRIQFSFSEVMDEGLSASGFTKIDVNLGTATHPIYLWYMSGSTQFDFPIVDLAVTTRLEDEPEMVHSGWERLALNRNFNPSGGPVHVWVKRSQPTFICDFQATIDFSEDTDLFRQGYIRVDEDFNQITRPTVYAVFLWYRHSKDQERGITEVDVSILKDDEERLKAKGFTKVDKNLNPSDIGGPIYLWYKCGQTAAAARFFTLLVSDKARRVYTEAKIKVVEKNLNCYNDSIPIYVAYE